MTDVQREALAFLTEVWELSPDVRLGQLMAHIGFLGHTHLGKGLGYIEDDELIAILDRHRAELKARLEGRPPEAPQPVGAAISGSPDPVLGAMRDAAEEMDEIIDQAMTHRERQPWRLPARE
jgi:hypothetical protein